MASGMTPDESAASSAHSAASTAKSHASFAQSAASEAESSASIAKTEKARRNWRNVAGYFSIFLVVVLVASMLYQNAAYHADLVERDQARAVVNEKLDRNNDALLCATELQKQESIAINNLLLAAFASGDPVSSDLQKTIDAVAELTARFEKAKTLCDADGVLLNPDGTTTTSEGG